MPISKHAIVETEHLRREDLTPSTIDELKVYVHGLDFTPAMLAELEDAGSITMQQLLRKDPANALVHSLPDTVSKAIMYLNMINKYDDRGATMLGRMAAALEITTTSYRAIFDCSGSKLSARNDFTLAAALEARPDGLEELLDYVEGPFSSLFVEGIRRRTLDVDAVIEASKIELRESGAMGLEIFSRVPKIPAPL